MGYTSPASVVRVATPLLASIAVTVANTPTARACIWLEGDKTTSPMSRVLVQSAVTRERRRMEFSFAYVELSDGGAKYTPFSVEVSAIPRQKKKSLFSCISEKLFINKARRDTVVKILGHVYPLRAWCNA